jgi:histidine triad (HIT) family protein
VAEVTRDLGGSGSGQGFRAITNAGEHGVQEVPHFHLHILGGRSPPGPPNCWLIRA